MFCLWKEGRRLLQSQCIREKEMDPTRSMNNFSKSITSSSSIWPRMFYSQSTGRNLGVEGAMGYQWYQVNSGEYVSGVCPLANMGNTCFINSVLYTLRFLPGFSHDLHHLQMHLQSAGEQKDIKLKQRVQFLSELHQVFVCLSQKERSPTKKRIPAYEAFKPNDFLEALRVVNPRYEGYQQQDASELLHFLLEQLWHLPQDLLQVRSDDMASAGWGDSLGASPPRKRLRRSERMQAVKMKFSKAVDVVGSKFVGCMRPETRCLKCGQVTGREENFLEVCVPVKTKADFEGDESISEPHIFMEALRQEEYLQGNNKYWCDHCSHLNEAQRSVHYSQLPHHLVIQVKRYHSNTKNIEAMPAPLILPCFCRGCYLAELDKDAKSSHLPYYLTAVVCHLGATLSFGHYVSFVRVSALQSLKCPEQQQQPPSYQAHHPSPGTSTQMDCQWMGCCGLLLEHIHPLFMLDGYNDEKSSQEQDEMWLECNDEEVTLVTSREVYQMMRTTNISPYLLFYSQL